MACTRRATIDDNYTTCLRVNVTIVFFLLSTHCRDSDNDMHFDLLKLLLFHEDYSNKWLMRRT